MQKIQVSENWTYHLDSKELVKHSSKVPISLKLASVEDQKCKVTGLRLNCHAFRVIQREFEKYISINLCGINLSEKRKFEKECYSSGIDIQTKIEINRDHSINAAPELVCLKELSEDHINIVAEHLSLSVTSYQDEPIEDCAVTQNVDFDSGKGSIIWCPFELTLYTFSELQFTKYCYLLVKLIENSTNINQSTDMKKVEQEKEYLIGEIEKLFLSILLESRITFLD